MTEEEWLTADNPTDMLQFWNPKASERKLRLFNCGCCRLLWHLFSESVTRDAVEAAEKVADGQLYYNCVQQPMTISPELERAFQAVEAGADKRWPYLAAVKVLSAYRPDYGWAWEDLAFGPDGKNREAVSNDLRSQARLFRCVFGDPFRKTPTFQSAWRTSTVLTLAQTMYDSRDFSAMPILADALQDAGCDHADILSHCRGIGPHVRGCWVIDACIGKE